MKDEKDIYKFDSETHTHQLNGKALTGCTTILNVIAKPFLIPWAANMTAGFLKSKLEQIKELNQAQWEELLDEARKIHTKKKEKAGDYGTQVHKEISKIIQVAIKESNGVIGGVSTTNKSIRNFVDWAVKNNVKFLASERNVWSKRYFLGGILDGLLEMDGKIWLMDIKTAKSGLYANNFWQLSGYEIMLNECSDYKKIDGYILLNLKENGEFLEKRSVSNKEHRKAFLACLEIYRQSKKIENQLL